MGKNWRRGMSKKNGVIKSNTIPSVLWKDYRLLGTWYAVAQKYGITKAMAFRVAHGYEPKKYSIRVALGLPAHITIRAVPCASCGEVKTVKRCPCKRKPAPRRQWKRLATWAASMLIYMEGTQ